MLMNPLPFMGTARSFISYGPQWAHACSAVNSLYKGYSAEGGIHTPMIVKLPHAEKAKPFAAVFATIMDLAPTFLEMAGIRLPSVYKGRQLAAYKGTSMLSYLEGKTGTIHDEAYVMGWELFGRCAIRQGKWKITQIEPPFGSNVFELFNLEEDPTESHDVASLHPDQYRKMLDYWQKYVEENGVILMNP